MTPKTARNSRANPDDGTIQGMNVSLRDFFAAHVAAALTPGGESPDSVASRAYDVAEALLRERSFRDNAFRREDEDEDGWERSPAEEDRFMMAESDFEREGLLDAPAPLTDPGDPDPSWDDRAFDPRWEAEPHWSADSSEPAEGQGIPSSNRPGIRSTRPGAAPDEATNERTGAGGIPGKATRSA